MLLRDGPGPRRCAAALPPAHAPFTLVCRLLEQAAGYAASFNSKPLPGPEGSREWVQALAARLKAVEQLCQFAAQLASLAQERLQWPLALRYRLACGAAFAIDGAPRVLAAAWSSPHTTAALHEQAALLSRICVPLMLETLNYFMLEVSSGSSSIPVRPLLPPPVFRA